ncbi:hypothetical protein OAM69_03850 [bacterium]|nr:hypothetical protein [bacterium]
MATTKPRTNPALPLGALGIVVTVGGLIYLLNGDSQEIGVEAATKTGTPIVPAASADGDSTQDALRALRAEQMKMLEENQRLREEKEDISELLKAKEEERTAELKDITQKMADMAETGSSEASNMVDQATEQFNDLTTGLQAKIEELEGRIANQDEIDIGGEKETSNEIVPAESLPAPVPEPGSVPGITSEASEEKVEVSMVDIDMIPTLDDITLPDIDPIQYVDDLSGRRQGGSSVNSNNLPNVVWVRSFDQKAAKRVGANSDEGVLSTDISTDVENIGSLLSAPVTRSTLSDDNDIQVSFQPTIDPNVVSSRRQLNTAMTTAMTTDIANEPTTDNTDATAVAQPNAGTSTQGAEEKKTEPFYTIPDGSVLANATAITSLMGIVYKDNNIVNPIQAKILIGRDNLTANFKDLPDELEGMIFGGYAFGVPAFGCVSVNLTYATYVFSSGEVETAYIGDPGTRPSNEAYRQDTIGYLTDEYGNPCIAGEYITDAPKQIAALTLLDAASGYANALRQQEVDTSIFSSETGNVVVEELNGSPSRFATATGLSAGFENASELLREKYSTIYEAYFVPGGATVSVHLEAELRIDKEPDARLISYQRTSGIRRSLD